MIKEYTKEQDIFILKNRDMSFTKIAQELDLTRDQVRHRYEKLVKIATRDEHEKKEIFNTLIDGLKKYSPKIADEPEYDKDRKYLLEINLTDLHYGKLTWAPESGDDFDIEIASKVMTNKVYEILYDAQKFGIDRILFIYGNDFFQADNQNSATSKGTLVPTDSRWPKFLKNGVQLTTDTIDTLLKVAPVDILCIPGNHENLVNFLTGETIAAYYRNNKNVNIDNSPKKRKYYRYGKTLLGFTHGDQERIGSLPLLMAQETKEDWALADWKEIHLGHWHNRQASSLYHTTDGGIVIRKLPALSAKDAWHYAKGYSADRATEAFLFHKQTGYKATISANVTNEDNAELEEIHA